MNAQLRNYRPSDGQTMLDISAAAEDVDRHERRLTPAWLAEWLTIPGVQPEADFFIAEADGRPVGYASFDVQVGTHVQHLAFGDGVVHPAYRRQGIGGQLMAAIEARAAEKMRGLPGGMGRHMEVFCRSTHAGAAALFESRGLQFARRFYQMECALDSPAPSLPMPVGLSLGSYQPEHDEAARLAFNDAFQDHWNFEPVSQADWAHLFRGVPHFRPELWMLAFDGDEIVGFCLNFVEPEYIELAGRQAGKVGLVGVRPGWRKRGLASALLAHSLGELRGAGMDFAVLSVDSQNASNAARIYERVGFREMWQNAVYTKEL